jgi:hypothetical protein
MRTLSELINLKEPAWPMVQEWLKRARNQHQVLEVDRARSEQVLVALQVTTRSPMGAIALESGGIWFDHGWLRFLGGGGPRFGHDLASWNGLPGHRGETAAGGALVVAWDVAGGFFAINAGLFEGNPGDVFYFAAETLQWDNLGVGYSGLLQWALSCNLDEFYADVRWPNWKRDIESLSGDQGLQFHPPLYTEEARQQPRYHHPVPMQELWKVACESIDALTLA